MRTYPLNNKTEHLFNCFKQLSSLSLIFCVNIKDIHNIYHLHNMNINIFC